MKEKWDYGFVLVSHFLLNELSIIRFTFIQPQIGGEIKVDFGGGVSSPFPFPSIKNKHSREGQFSHPFTLFSPSSKHSVRSLGGKKHHIFQKKFLKNHFLNHEIACSPSIRFDEINVPDLNLPLSKITRMDPLSLDLEEHQLFKLYYALVVLHWRC